MSENRTNVNLSGWRTIFVPLLVTVAAIAFWMTYYGSIGWWPFVLFVIWVVQYTRFSQRRRSSDD